MQSNCSTLINQILALPWNQLNLQTLTTLMWVSLETAQEFAQSLHVGLELYPHDLLLRSMAQGELETDNLRFGSWKQTGDHSQFLAHFLANKTEPETVMQASKRYNELVQSLEPITQAMSVFSRENELPGIFQKILESPVWNNPLPEHLKAFHYYLKTHVELDSAAGGHQDLVNHLEITEAVTAFYQARLQLYLDTIPCLKT